MKPRLPVIRPRLQNKLINEVTLFLRMRSICNRKIKMASNVLEEGISKKELQPEESVPPAYKAAGENFLSTFYQTFDTNRTALGQLFVCRNFQNFRLYIFYHFFVSFCLRDQNQSLRLKEKPSREWKRSCSNI